MRYFALFLMLLSLGVFAVTGCSKPTPPPAGPEGGPEATTPEAGGSTEVETETEVVEVEEPAPDPVPPTEPTPEPPTSE